MLDGPIAVVGATGYTGKLTVAALARRGIPVRAVGRNPQKLAALAAAHDGVDTRASAWTAADIAEALRGCAAVISCAGPFAQVGQPVAEGAVRARVPYCDSTGEQTFIQWVFEALDQPARAAGVALVPAAGFDYVPGDLGAAIVAAGMGPLERLDVVYGVERLDTSAGTRVSSVGIMASQTVLRQDGALQPLRIGSKRRSVDLGFRRMTGGLSPSGDAFHAPRHLDVRTVYGYLALPGRMNPGNPGSGLFASSLKLPGAQAALRALARRGPEGPDAETRNSRAACHVQAQSVAGERRAVLVEGRDVYGFTADALSELALRLGEGADATGACAPAEVAGDPRAFLAGVGWSVREVAPE
jgi:short subunit dehydrogenase-like uncharacterized protein